MFPRFVLYSGLILSWISFLFIPNYEKKKFFPAALLGSVCLTFVYEMAYINKWWKLNKLIAKWLRISDYSFILGPFFVGTIWIFHLTYKFGSWVFFLSNLILDSFFAFAIMPLFERIGIVKLKRIKRIGILGLMQSVAVVIFFFQKWIENIYRERPDYQNDEQYE
ncbi:hypothetical protein GCM10008967_17520 [Bacillus carboniphilus]|uniref:Permease n=2 Tax=Bacillus carboniphilus TaxID=86663 RepID=A0ABN0W768_9BACI